MQTNNAYMCMRMKEKKPSKAATHVQTKRSSKCMQMKRHHEQRSLRKLHMRTKRPFKNSHANEEAIENGWYVRMQTKTA